LGIAGRASRSTEPENDLMRPWREAAWIAAYGLSWWLGYHVSTDYWFLPAGLRFACLWAAPRRLWPWLAASEFAAILVVVLQGSGYRTWPGFVLGVFAPWLVHAGAIAIANPAQDARDPDTPWRMGRLLLAMLGAALLTACLLTAMSFAETGPEFSDPLLHVLRFAIGDFIAMLIVVPIWLHVSTSRLAGAAGIARDLALFFVPLLALVLLVPALRSRAVVYLGLLALLPMIFLVFRHGWKGGGWTLAFTSVVLYASGELLHAPVTREVMQLFLAVVGAISLMLGASVTALRSARDALSARNEALAVQAAELRALSQRLVRAQEDEQRRIAQELQGELEQGMTTLGTRLGMLARTPLEPAQMAAVDSLRGLTQDIQASVRDVLTQVRPMVLDRHGLEHALRAGPIRDLLTDAEVRFDVLVRGALSELDADVQSAIYRICQEAALDCVRRQRGRRFELALRVVGIGSGQHAVELDLGCGLADADGGNDGADAPVDLLPGTRDRVLALGGDYRCKVDAGTLRHEVRFVAGDGAAPARPG
jgi:glucose-6-phosphate-specific signal transduction histidine kinase